MKKKFLVLLVLILALSSLCMLFLFSASATGASEPTVRIEYFNLVFKDNVYLKYAVKFENVDNADITKSSIGMLYFTEPQEEYVEGNESFSSSVVGSTTIEGEVYYTFEYRMLAAKQMTDYIYSVAYIDIDGVRYYSNPVKYSILTYAYSKLGKIDSEASDNQYLKSMLSNMLAYGADAQRYFNYNTTRLADADYFLVKVAGGTLEDGFTKGLYLTGETATLTAHATNDGLVFTGWKNSEGEIVSTDNPLVIVGVDANETYTAIYEDPYISSTGLKYTSNNDGTCYVSGIGSCTYSDIIIAPKSPAGDTVTAIGEAAFKDCKNITSVVIPDGVTSIGDGAFYACSELTSAVIPDSVTSIGLAAFSNCSKLTSAVIPDNVTTIAEYTFYGCHSLANVTFGDNVTSIKFGAFYNCQSLESVVIPDGLTSIGDSIFGNCRSLTSVVIPASVNSISLAAFDECTDLVSVYYMGTESDWSKIAIGDYNTYLLAATRYDYSETKPTVGGNFWHYVDGVVTVWLIEELKFTSNGDGTCYVSGLGTVKDTDIIIPSTSRAGDTVISIGANAFKDCTNLTSIEISDTVTSIGASALYGCTNITSVVIPDSVTSIDNYAFRQCDALTSIIIPDSVISIGEFAFGNCDKLATAVLGNGIATIGPEAFYGCAPLETVYYKGSVSDWSKVSAQYNTDIEKATLYYYSESAPTASGNFWHYVDDVITVWPGMLAFTSNGDGTCYVSGLGTLKDTDIIIPSTSPAGDTVISIGANAFKDCTNLTSIEIPDTVTSIGASAFQGCTNITSVVIPESVTSIDNYAFRQCDALTSIIIPDSVISIGEFSFGNCDKLETAVLGNGIATIGSYAFYGCAPLKTVYYKGSVSDWSKVSASNNTEITKGATLYYYSESAPTTLGNFWHYVDGVITAWPGMLAFTSNGDGTCYVSGLGTLKDTDIIIPSTSPAGDTVTSIGANAFKDCTNLTSIEISDTVTSIGASAFYGCTNITSVVIPNSVTSIDNYAFRQCDALTSIIIPDSVISIGEFAFGNCDKLATAVLGNGIATIGSYAFYGCAPLETVYYKGSVSDWSKVSASSNTEITTGATLYYYSETEPTSLGNFWHYVDGIVTVWPEFVSSSSEGLEFVSNGDGTCYVKSIGTCTDATEVVIPTTSPDGDTVTSIGEKAFKDCTTFTRIVIPDSVTQIGSQAFRNCSKLKSIEIPDSVTSIGIYAFCNCTALTSVKLSNKLTTVNSYMFNGCSELASIVIPDSVTSIGSNAFQDCKKLLTVEFSSKLTSIGSTAFKGCSILTSVVLPDTLTSISSYAFASCNGLTSIVIPNGVTQIYSSTFEYCNYLTTVTLPEGLTSIGSNAFASSALTAITLPETLTKIGDSAFQSCDFESITIPANVTKIGKNAFLSCSNLTSVTFADTTTWYMSTSASSGGTQQTVTKPETNATALKSYDNQDKYWYKK